MQFVAREDIVIATRGAKVNQTRSGLLLATNTINQYATVVGLGPMRLSPDREEGLIHWDFALGDQVIVGENPVNTITEDGVEYEFYRSKAIVAVIPADPTLTTGLEEEDEQTPAGN